MATMKQKATRRGRPLEQGIPRDRRVTVRFTESDFERVAWAARRVDLDLASAIRSGALFWADGIQMNVTRRERRGR